MDHPLRSIRVRVGAAVILMGALTGGALFAWRMFHTGHTQATVDAGAASTAGPPSSHPPAHPDESWTGSRKCAECHAEIWASYQSHPMAHSSASVSEAEIVEDYAHNTSFSKPASRHYRAERIGERVWHHESMTDADGKTIYDQAVEIHYAIGSGRRGRTYLIERGSLLKASPITWYTQGKTWDLSPGYLPADHQRFDRRVADECVVCHVGRAAFETGKPNRFDEPPFLEAAIGCERCHGPGGNHVRRHEVGVVDAGASDPIVNPRDLEPGAREDVCNQCHLVGYRILRYGRSTFDFRPGERLEDTWAIFPKDLNPDSSEVARAVGQVDQMRESVCFKSSEGRMGCISCHDPHSLPPAADRRAFFDKRCAACHVDKGCAIPDSERQAAPAAGSCIACHMPALPASNVPHTSQTDHRILRKPSDTKKTRPKAGSELFDNAQTRLPKIDLLRARGIVQAQEIAGRNDVASAASLEKQLRDVLAAYPDDVQSQVSLATLVMLQRRPAEAKDLLLGVLSKDPENEAALRNLAKYNQERGQSEEAIVYLLRLTAIDPSSPELQLNLAEMLWQSNRLPEAIAAAERGVELDPRHRPLRTWLARAYRESGRVEAAREQDQILRRMERR